MLIEIHAIQNHSPANLNRDDLGAPKTCYFGGVLRSRISSQCLKRSIRMSKEFSALLGGVRTRQLARCIAEALNADSAVKKRAARYLRSAGSRPKAKTTTPPTCLSTRRGLRSRRWPSCLQEGDSKTDDQLATEFGELIAKRISVPDMALGGRMLETGKLADTTVEAALQVAHAISTHGARPEVDYYVAADDIPGEDAGAAYVNEAMFASACFYKYFSIDWGTLLENLAGFQGNREHLAAHTVGAFIRAAALTNPTGKQNSFAAHNPPDGMLIEFKDTPTSYANAFAAPVSHDGGRDLISQSVAQLGQYVHDLDVGYGKPRQSVLVLAQSALPPHGRTR